MRTSAPSALASSSVPVRAGHAHHVAEAGEDHARLVRDARCRRRRGPSGSRRPGSRGRARARRSPAAGRRRRTCRSSACGRRRPPSACSGGRARRSRGSRRRATRPSSASRNSSTNLISPPPAAAPACTSSRVAHGATGSTSAISTVLCAPSSACRARARGRRRPPAPRIGTPSSEQVMQWSE